MRERFAAGGSAIGGSMQSAAACKVYTCICRHVSVAVGRVRVLVKACPFRQRQQLLSMSRFTSHRCNVEIPVRAFARFLKSTIARFSGTFTITDCHICCSKAKIDCVCKHLHFDPPLFYSTIALPSLCPEVLGHVGATPHGRVPDNSDRKLLGIA